MKNLLIWTFLIVFIFPVSVVQAQTAVPTGIIRGSVKEKVAEELSRIKQAVTRKGYVGSVTGKTDATLTLVNLKNQTRTVTLTPDATIKLANSKDGTISDIKTNDFVIAMGDADSQNNMTAKRILVLASPPNDKRAVHYGAITKLGTNALTLKTLKETLEVKISAGTKYNEKYKFSDLKTDTKIVLIATTGTNNSLTALRIQVLP